MGQDQASHLSGPSRPPRLAVLAAVRAALAEDLGTGDVTSEAVVAPEVEAEGWFIAKAPGVVAGLWVSEMVFCELDARIVMETLVSEGDAVRPRDRLARVRGPARPLLSGERVALNFLQRLSGIATMARAASQAVAGTRARVLDTRKTTPGLRSLEKYAVRAGGATSHRFGLYDMVLIKDNHIRLAGGIAPAVKAARQAVGPAMKIEVEAATLEEVSQALAAGVELIMLDNMDLENMRRAVEVVAGRAMIEASGGIKVADLPAVARSGVDFISMGSLTHSYASLDISLELQPIADAPTARG